MSNEFSIVKADANEMRTRVETYLAAIDAAADAGDREDWGAQGYALQTAVAMAAVIMDMAACGIAVPNDGSLATLADAVRASEKDAPGPW